MTKTLRKITLWLITLLFSFVVLSASACDIAFIKDIFAPDEPDTPSPPPSTSTSLENLTAVEGEFSIHFMMLGNKYAGDCVYIKAGEYDILIDAGSLASSIDTIEPYLDTYVTDDTLEFVIITHADKDHIASFTGTKNIFSQYVCQTIIDFPLTEKTTQIYGKYVANRDAEVEQGATHYTALECYNNLNGAQREYQLTENISFEILYNYYYDNDAADENNYSVCAMFKHGDRQFLFTGDLEEDGEERLAEKYDFSQVVFYKAGHHGSKTSSNDILLSEIKPQICVASCVAGTPEYTSAVENQFPTQAFIDRISNYTDKVFIPSQVDYLDGGGYSFKAMNGNIVLKSYETKVEVVCSNHTKFLKDTDWFKEYRTCPAAWQQVA